MPIFFSPSVYAQWTSVGPPLVSTYWRLHGVYFTSPSNGWAVGWDRTNKTGVLLHYSEDTWTSAPPPFVSTDWNLRSVHFTSPSEGWAVGWDNANYAGVLLHYSDNTWTPVSLPSVSTSWGLYGVHFTSSSEGWAVGGDSTNKTGVLLRFLSSPISPDEETIGTEITITGSGYGTTKGKVLVGTAALKILEWTDSTIRGLLSKALLPDTYDITIQPKGASPIVLPGSFTVKPPQIDSMSSSSGSDGDNIAIYGSFFGTKKGKVTLGGKKCKVISWAMDSKTGESEIKFLVPKGLSLGTKELKVINSVGSDTGNFTVD
ncbi:MAG: IPT/TIG domain-containing protein, partial [Thermodesulfobacteriota bacterium]